jgi:hypothetical protein
MLSFPIFTSTMAKLLIFLLLLFGCWCREIYYEDLKYWPKNNSDLIEYETIKLTRSKNKTLIYFKGSFSLLKPLGNEKLVFMELHNRDALMVKNAKPFCEFIRSETIFWPELTKSSDMPKDNPCPFPAVSEIICQKN